VPSAEQPIKKYHAQSNSQIRISAKPKFLTKKIMFNIDFVYKRKSTTHFNLILTCFIKINSNLINSKSLQNS
jgi:hypothetical protein